MARQSASIWRTNCGTPAGCTDPLRRAPRNGRRARVRRLLLERGEGERTAGWLLCNPSTADAEREAIDAIWNPERPVPLCLGMTSDDLPLHPLARGKHVVRNDAALLPWNPDEQFAVSCA